MYLSLIELSSRVLSSNACPSPCELVSYEARKRSTPLRQKGEDENNRDLKVRNKVLPSCSHFLPPLALPLLHRPHVWQHQLSAREGGPALLLWRHRGCRRGFAGTLPGLLMPGDRLEGGGGGDRAVQEGPWA